MSDTEIQIATAAGAISDRQVARHNLQAWSAAALTVLRDQVWLITVILGYIALGMAVGRWYGQVIKLDLYSDIIVQLYLVLALGVFSTRAFKLFRHHRPVRPIAFLISDFKSFYLAPQRLLTPLPALFLIPLMISVISSIKRLIPVMQPFHWDYAFAELDRMVHGGLHPWVLLQPLLGHPIVTSAISEFYGAPWLIAVAVMQFWLIFTTHPERQRLLLTYVLSWILLGNLAAVALSSAGPVYYAHFIDGPNPYQDLIVYMAQVNESIPLSARETQAFLWSMYEFGDLRPGTGISAMPSMHLSMATMMLLAARRVNRKLALCALGYLVFLEIGSVHLGWHFAIDGYAGIAGTLAIWWVLGRIVPGTRDRPLAARPGG